MNFLHGTISLLRRPSGWQHVGELMTRDGTSGEEVGVG
jgi:hypothetical protein